jgi:hypothetical protein
MQSIGRNLSASEGVISAGVNVEGSGVSGSVTSASGASSVGGKAKPNRSAVACAAYRSGSSLVEKIYDKESGVWFENLHNYSHKEGVVFSQIFAPEGAPSWMLERVELWNRIQNEFDTRRDAVFAKEMDIALPRELSVEQNIELVSEFVEDVLAAWGLVADVNFHNDNENNPHVHIMTSTRHIITLEDGSNTFGNKIREIDNKSFLHYLRASFASYVNKHLERCGVAERVDHRSYKDRGITIIPSIHEGVGRHCENSDRARINAEIMNARAAQIVSEPEQVIKLLGISNAYFSLAMIEEKVASFILDASNADSFVIRDNVGDAGNLENSGESENLGKSSNNTGPDLNKFSVDSDGKIVFDSAGYSKLTEVRGSIVASVLGSDSIVRLGGLSELGEYYTTAARVQLEERFLNLARTLVGVSGLGTGVDKGSPLWGALSHGEIELLKAPDPVKKIVKTDQQQFVVKSLIEAGPLTQLYGYAGTGKSTVLTAVRDIYVGRGVSVIGIAPTAKSRGVLSDLGIEARTLHSLKSREEWVEGILRRMESKDFEGLKDLEMSIARNYKTPFDANTVFMLDEASMVGLDIYSWLIERCSLSGAKLISIGDYNQLPVVKGVGGGYRALVDNFADKTSSLTEIWRQEDPVYQDITTYLATYKVSEALSLLKSQKPEVCQFIDGDRRDVELRLVSDYVAWFKEQNSLRDKIREQSFASLMGTLKYELGSTIGYSMDGGFIDASKSGVIISYLREDIARLNQLVRQDLYLSGVLEKKVFVGRADSSHGSSFVSASSEAIHHEAKSDNARVGLMVARGAPSSGMSPIALLLGEQIMFLKNDKRVGLYNGEVGTILDIRESVGGKVLDDESASADKSVVSGVRSEVNSLAPACPSYDILVRIHTKDGKSRLQLFNSAKYGNFDYGYASTIHKVQGSSYFKIFFDFSKYVGFESFYVAVTRHQKDLTIYFNKKELVSILYQRYGVSEENLASRSLSGSGLSRESGLTALTGLKGANGDERNLYFAALEAHVVRPSSDIFVSKFVGTGRGSEVDGSSRSVLKPESIFGEYHLVRNKAASLYREMIMDVGSSSLKRVSDHGRWNEFKDLTSKRGELAKVIVSDIDSFEACLKITKANMSVIRDHAGVSVFGVEKIYGKVGSNGVRLDSAGSTGSNSNISGVRFTERSALSSEYRNICDMQMDALYRGQGEFTHRDVVLANLMLEASSFSRSQRSIADEMEGFYVKRENLTQQLRSASQDIEVCTARMSNLSEGLGKIYSDAPKIVVDRFSEYLRESGVSLDELSIALKDDKISDNVRRLELHKVDLSKFGEIKGKEYNLGLFKLSGFDKRQNLANREFVVNNIVEYLNSERDLGVLLEKKTHTDGELVALMRSYDKDMEVRESKFLGYVALGHLEKITSNGEVVSLDKWLETSEALKSCFSGYELIRRENGAADLVEGKGDKNVDRRIEVDRDLFLNRSEIWELKQSLLSRMAPASIVRFFEVNRGDVGAGDLITVRSGVLKCGSFNLHLSGEKAGQWYRFSRSEGGDIYKLAEVLGVHGSGGEWNNFKVMASFAGIDVDKILKRCSENGSQNIIADISKEIQGMRLENISGLGSNYVASYKDKWVALAQVPSDARGFDLLKDTPYLVGKLDGSDGRAKIYDYKDMDGNLACHIVRLDKNGGGKAIYPSGVCILPEHVSREKLEALGVARFEMDDKSQRIIMHITSDTRFKDLEKEGFRKVDLLASNMLDKTRDVMEEINKKYGVNLSVDEVFSSALRDRSLYSVISSGDTEGIFQLESEGAKDICKSIRPKDFDSLVNILALNRPGTREWAPLFTQISTRESDQEPQISRNVRIPTPPHDPMGVFASTKGAILFQEQVMEAGVKYFGIGEKDSDGFRRDFASKPIERVIANEEKCIERYLSLHKDISRGQAESLYSSLEKFAGFGFNKSHAVAYAKHTLVSAYLKAHYRDEFCKGFGISDDMKRFEKKQNDKEAISSNITWNYNTDFMKEVERLAPQVVRNWKTNINSSADVGQMIKAAKSVILEDQLSGKLDESLDMSVMQKSILSHIEGITRVQNRGYSDLIDVKGEALGEDMEYNYTNKTSEKMKIEIKAEMISKICAGLGRYNEKEYVGSSDNSLYQVAQELYNKRDKRIESELKHNAMVMEFGESAGLDAAKYFATQIVDYKMQQDPRDSGAWKNMLTERRLEMMKNVSYQQVLFDKQIDGALQVSTGVINNGGGQEGILTPEIISADKLAMRELAQLKLCRDMTIKMQEMGIDNLDVATAQKMRNEAVIASTKELEHLQNNYIAQRREELEENKERQMTRSQGRGMEM